jgi:outer membrane lipoprotein-sorting protein
MRTIRRSVSIAALALPLLLSGCFVISTNRRLPVPTAPAQVETVTPSELVARLNQRWAAFNSLTAKVEIQLSVLKTEQGVARDYTSIPGIILIRKPDMLRIYGQVPVIRTEMFDMASNGKSFTLFVPHCNKVYKGSDAIEPKPISASAGAAVPASASTSACDSNSLMEELRPGFFLDAMMVRGLEPDDDYSVVSDSETVEDASKKHLLFTPEYVLSVTRRKPGSHQMTPVRVVTFHRDHLLPSEQDLYDSNGNLETHIAYTNYQDAGTDKYPSTITIKRPLEDFQIVLTIEKVTENVPLNDEQFVVNVPSGAETRNVP